MNYYLYRTDVNVYNSVHVLSYTQYRHYQIALCSLSRTCILTILLNNGKANNS